MREKTIFCDESGFTGNNLLDANQPIFTIASTDILSEEAEEILRMSFPRYQGEEFKFMNIWGRGHQRSLPEFARRVESVADRAIVWVVDKKFAVLTKIIDFLIEPHITAQGYDFYADGFCRKYANHVHYGLSNFASPELYDALIKVYQAFSRNADKESLKNLQTQLGIMASSTEEPARMFLEQMSIGASLFERFHDLSSFTSSDELQLTSLVALVCDWRKRHEDAFHLVHDASSNFFRRKEVWENITSADVPAQLMPLGDGSHVQYPLRVLSTRAVNSKESRSVQFCDVLAGLFTRIFSPQKTEEQARLLEEVAESGLMHVTYNGIMFHPDFPESPPKTADGPDVVDRMIDIVFGKYKV